MVTNLSQFKFSLNKFLTPTIILDAVLWLNQTGVVIVSGKPEGVESYIEMNPHYFLLSFRLMLLAPLLLLSLNLSLSVAPFLFFGENETGSYLPSSSSSTA